MFKLPCSARQHQLVLPLMTVILAAGCRGNANNRAPEATSGATTTTSPATGTSTAAAAPSASAAAAATGKTWDVKMLGDASGYRFDPVTLTIKVGDAVRWTVVSGPPHNVTFWADSIPTGASSQLQTDMPQTMSPLTGPLLNAANQTYTISFVKVPAGTYSYYCTPHLALGMRGKLIIHS